jgi:PAS domain S-box-containing protein
MSPKPKKSPWKENLSQLRSLYDMAYNGVVIIDEQGIIQVYNRAARKLLGISTNDLAGHLIKEINPKAWQDMKEIIRTGSPQIAKKINLGRSTLIANRTPIFFEGKVVGVMSIFQDISEYEKVSSDLESFKRLNEELDAIIESSYDGLYITDGQAKTLRVNQAYERITGLKKEELTGKKTSELVSEGIFDPSVTLEVIRARRPQTIMQEIKGGKVVIVTGNPIFDSQNRITRVVTNVRDLTELNQLKNELEESKQLTRRYQDELIEQQILNQAGQQLLIKSEPMRLVMQKAIKMARVDSAALLTGESGVGKDILARFIHKNSLRQGKSFIKINCGAIPETLLESELFGYEKGAFTGARTEGKAGLFEIGQGGTVFLDEIAELPLYLQVKILAVLEDKEITRLGGTKPKHIDFRIIAATNRDLLSLVNSGDFRKDLYFRLSTLPLDLPPLRERRDDIVPLINHFLKKFTRSDQTKKTLTPRAYEILGQYSFPGNVRELMNIVERLVVMSDKKTLGPEDLPAIIQEGTPLSRDRKTPGGLKETVSEFEKGLIEEALKRHKTISRVALAFGVNPSTISRKVQQHGLIRP